MRFSSVRLDWLLLPLLLACCSATSGSEAQAAPKSAAASGASSAQTAAKSPRVTFAPPGRDPVTVRVEVVRTPEERQRGLMYRKHLEPDAGMLFIFERSQQLTFWMRNTYLPLDMIFVTDDMTVLGIVENATPLTEAPRSVPGLARYVVEVNAGFSRQHGLAAGTKMSSSNLPTGEAR